MLDLTADIIDIRDIIERFEVVEGSEDDLEEFAELRELLEELRDNGGDEQWRGDWYPVTLIRDSYFEDYARDLADELGLVPVEDTWPASYIDWKAAADALISDYSEVTILGVDYWYQS